VQNGAQKFEATSVGYNGESSKTEVQRSASAGTTTKLMFETGARPPPPTPDDKSNEIGLPVRDFAEDPGVLERWRVWLALGCIQLWMLLQRP